MEVNHVVVLMIDDLGAEQFFELLSANMLPNIKKHFHNSIFSRNMICTYPSITIPSQHAILTGYYPDKTFIPMMSWFDRKKNIYRDYSVGSNVFRQNEDLSKEIKTVYERVDGNRVSMHIGLRRGANYSSPPEWVVKLRFLTKFMPRDSFMKTTGILAKNFTKPFEEPKRYFENAEPPSLAVGLFFASDAALHMYGSNSEKYLKVLRDIDGAIGKIIDKMKSLGYGEDTAFIICTDHGNFTAERILDINEVLVKKGLKPYNFKKRKGDFFAINGVQANIHLHGDDWFERPTLEDMRDYNGKDMVELSLNLPGVERVFCRDGKKVVVESKEGFAEIVHKDNKTKYKVEGRDPLGYEDLKIADGKYHDIDEWLKYTYNINFPLVADNIWRYLETERSPDMLLGTDWKTCYTNHRYNHGIGSKSCMSCPLMISVPDGTKKEIPYAKVADVAATILQFFGKKPEKDMASKPINIES